MRPAVATGKRAPNKSIEEPLVNAARSLARGQRGRYSRLEVVELMTSDLRGLRRRLRRQVVQAVISRLVTAGFFHPTNEYGVLRFDRMGAPLPWDAFVQRRREEAIERLRRRLGTLTRGAKRAPEPEAARSAIRRLQSRLRKLEAHATHH